MEEGGVELTVLMPCLNEARTVAKCVEAARNFLRAAGVHGEVLVADNGSTDGSQALAEAAGARVVPVSERGYGAALIGGISEARGRYVIMGDADDSYDFSRLQAFVAKLREGADLVMGNRFRGGIEQGAMPFLHRYLGNPVLSFVGRLFFRTNIGDFHCGLRGFSRAAIQKLGLLTPGMEFASEMVAKAALAGLRIEEVPTTLRPDGRGRPPHLRTWRDGWRHLRFMFLFCPRWLFLYPGLALLLAGGGAMLAGLTSAGATHLGIHSMLYAGAAVILGVQMLAFALLTKWLAVLAGMVAEPKWMERGSPLFSIENGLLSGLALFLAGLVWSLAITLDWGRAGFGALNPLETMRSVIPAVTLIAIGSEVAMGSLFAGALLSSWRSRRAP
ncbi:glycosyltransferase family 2 protein [Ramlibacter sp. G-1-2-2]|uniref:Glycosyltransferase family 2 protein n=1 Tax=Ramlibacter agri TaxID=2728837 RepID=A0A848GZH3_9BURK|nr:glycosyltransferase family 2 protein [Ramlibacter agri]